MENLRHIPKTRWLSHYGSHHSVSAVIKLMAPCPLWSPQNQIVLKQILVIISAFKIFQCVSLKQKNSFKKHNHNTIITPKYYYCHKITIQCLNFLVVYCMCVHTQIFFFFSNSLLKQDPNKRYIYRLLLFTSPFHLFFTYYLLNLHYNSEKVIFYLQRRTRPSEGYIICLASQS